MENNNNRRAGAVDDQKHYDDKVRLGHLEREMGGIKGEVGLLKVAMTDNSARLANVQDQMHNISRSLEKMADRVHQPTEINWGWIFSGVMGILLIAGGYTQIVTEPLRADASRNYELVRAAQIDAHEVERRLSYQEGYLAGLREND
jgi:hypothetical protein